MGVLSRHLALVAIVTLGLVVCLAVAPRRAAAQMMSPGPLSQAHADIDGDDHCGKCHQSGKQVVSSLCLDCHEDLEKRIDASAGLHGRNYKGKGCETCHVEHISRKTKLIRWPGGSMDKLDHDLTGYDLEGGHVGPKCLECHTKAQPSGKPSFLGLKEACGSCHKDPHKNRYGAECTTCHRVSTWDDLDLDRFDHDRTAYKLTGLHVDVACQKCHGSPAKWKGIAFDTCASCHADPHEGKFAPTPCADCHDTKSWKGATEAIRKNHPGLSLRNGHRRVDCKRCHDKGIDAAPSKGSACVDCHAPVHEAKFGRGCKSCHKSIEWLGLPEQIGRDAHGKTPYPLTGMHTDVACAKCHPKKLPVDQRYRKLSYDACTGCHADVHGGRLTEYGGGACDTCHSVAGFAPTSFGVAAHAATRLPLEGRHAATPCGACHKGKRPRVDFTVSERACADCHANPHGDQFAAEMRDGGCAHCHAPAGWGQPKIDHATWPLTGVHERTPCARCHGEATGGDPATYRGVPRDCEGCHDDVHAGQFRLAEPVKACVACHDTQTFRLPGFDHLAQSGFAIEGKHNQVACEMCHPRATLRNGVVATRYRLGYRACKDCHADPHRGGAR